MSQSREDYIKFIHECGNGDFVSNKEIAEGLAVSRPSVSEMLVKLAGEDLVVYKPYQGVKLTPTGTMQALDLIRKHEIWEYFLQKMLHYERNEVHAIAELLEHSTDMELANRLAQLIKFPE